MVSTLDKWDDWCADVNTNTDPDWYQPELRMAGSTRPFRATTRSARARQASEERAWTFFTGFVYGMAVSLPLWFVLVVLAIWWGQR